MTLAAYLGFALIHLPHDKVIHFSTFLILTVEFYFLFDTRNKKILRVITFIVCTCGAGIGLEVVQLMVNPIRIFDFFDIISNVCGSCLGLLIACALNWRIDKSRQEKRRGRRIVCNEAESSNAIDDEAIPLAAIQMKN